jgi:prepilin-type N-terminal cleavage/methylation domain-containing protein
MLRLFKHHSGRGYTLVELLIVITIVVILGLAILIGINPMAQIFKGLDARRKADLNKIKIAIENYYADHDCYPNFPLDSSGNPTYVCDSDFLKPYLVSMPCDPSTKKPYTIYLTPASSSCPQQYAIYAQIYSFFDKNDSSVPDCPKTYVVNSSDMSFSDIDYGCSGKKICNTWYGCKNGACVVVAENSMPTCSRASCDSDCNPQKDINGNIIADCSTQTNGIHTLECIDK